MSTNEIIGNNRQELRTYIAMCDAIERVRQDRISSPGNNGMIVDLAGAVTELGDRIATGRSWRDAAVCVAAAAIRLISEGDSHLSLAATCDDPRALPSEVNDDTSS